ncbi:serine hydrolase domain-containing protein, partial [Actinosynnema sp. NPDC023658]|uniref:serine hydrolase domain-containing protein n=1 Tax=Actinosynnema sp. NPDC023658 TaxID=3155465 RepID=UPI0033D1ED38
MTVRSRIAHVVTPLLAEGRDVAIGVRCGDEDLLLTSDGVTPDARFELGSLTKTFTGLLLAEMAALGEVAHDHPVDRYLPSTRLPVTLEQLATHSSGLPGLPPGLWRSALRAWYTNPYRDYAVEDVLRSLARARTRPGVRYSNFGVGVLGLALARAADLPFEEVLARRVLRPLELSGTDCASTDQLTGHWH